MQLRLDLADGPAPAAALWELLRAEQRQAAVSLLAALIAQTVAGRGEEAVGERASLGGAGVSGGRGD